jgi:hypothetical protein
MCISSLNSRNATLSKVVGSRGNSHASRCTSAWMGLMKNTKQNKSTIIVWAFVVDVVVVAPRAEASEVLIFCRDSIFIVRSSTTREEEKTEKKKKGETQCLKEGGSVVLCRGREKPKNKKKKEKEKKEKKGEGSSGDKEKERKTNRIKKKRGSTRDQRKLKRPAKEKVEKKRGKGKRDPRRKEKEKMIRKGSGIVKREKERKPFDQREY